MADPVLRRLPSFDSRKRQPPVALSLGATAGGNAAKQSLRPRSSRVTLLKRLGDLGSSNTDQGLHRFPGRNRVADADVVENVLMFADRLLMRLAGAVGESEAGEKSGSDSADELSVDPVAARIDDGGMKLEVGAAPLFGVPGVCVDHVPERLRDSGQLLGACISRSMLGRGRPEQLTRIDQ